MPRPVPVLEGRLVRLRPLDPERDAPAYLAMNADEEMHRYTGNAPFGSLAEAHAELARFATMVDLAMWAVAEREEDLLIGRFFVCLAERDGRLVAGEGNRIARPYWRRGHNRDARALVAEYVFGTLGADRYETECWAENTNSRLSILAHGFTLIETREEYNERYGRSMTKCLFAMDRADRSG